MRWQLRLGGCATKLNLEAPYDELTFEKALPEADPPTPVQVVEVPKVLPLPGQLKPWPTKARRVRRFRRSRPSPLPTRPLGSSRRGRATSMPSRSIPGPKGRLSALHQSGEGLHHRAAAGRRADRCRRLDRRHRALGDRDTISGQGSTRRVHILVKPTLPDIQTNLVVLTDRRTYHLELVSTKQTYMASISWTYPTDSLVALHKQNQTAQES